MILINSSTFSADASLRSVLLRAIFFLTTTGRLFSKPKDIEGMRRTFSSAPAASARSQGIKLITFEFETDCSYSDNARKRKKSFDT